MSSGPHVTLN